MAYAHGTTSILKPDLTCVISPFASRNLRPQLVPFLHRYRGLPRSLEISYGAIKACPATKYVCRSHLVDSLAPTALGTKRAYIAVDDETNLAFIGTGLHKLGYTIVSKGDTAVALEKAGVPVTKPEKRSVSPRSGDTPGDEKHHADKPGSGNFDVVVVNSNPGYDEESMSTLGERYFRIMFEAEENDLVVVDPEDYGPVLAYLERNLEDPKFRNILALKRIHHGSDILCQTKYEDKARFDNLYVVPLSLGGGMTGAIQHHGEEMSKKNYFSADAAWNCVSDFFDPTCVIVKGSTPCVVVSRDDILEAFKLAIKSDRLNGSGGIVAFNVEVDEALASQIVEVGNPENGQEMFCKMVVAPGYTQKGLDVLCRKSKNLIVLEAKKPKRGERYFQQITGGWHELHDNKFRLVSDRNPTKIELDDVKFARVCGAHLDREALVLVKNKCMLSVGSGQSNNLENLRSALIKAGDEAKGAILSSSEIFPTDWKDMVAEACTSGVSVIVELGETEFLMPEEVQNLCNNYSVSLLSTGVFDSKDA